MVQNPPGRTGACSMAKLICYPRPKWTLSMKKPIESSLLSTLIFQVTPSPARPKVRVTRPTLGKPGSVLFLQSEGLPSYQQNWLMRCAFDEEHTWQPRRRKWQYQLMDQHVQPVGRRLWTALSCLYLPENNISKQQITIMSILIKPITKLELRKKYMEVRSSTSPILPFTFEQF